MTARTDRGELAAAVESPEWLHWAATLGNPDVSPRWLSGAELHAFRSLLARLMVAAYHDCGGDPDAMADCLMRTLLAPHVADAPPVEIDGELHDPAELAREQFRQRAKEAVAWFDHHGQPKH